ncbi:MAG: OB-fold nucleic acid binding domain-containing protein [Bacilli bacterium]|nr:OB-fold nucleic acid binding domain-containing protein [Bacilli bacterium]
MKIKELNEGIRVIENYLVTNVTKGTSNSGQLYLTVTLQDNTGQIEARVWDASDVHLETFKQGTFVKVVADVIEYRSNLQLKVLTAEELSAKDVKIEEFTIVSPVKLETLKAELDRLLKSLTHPSISKIVNKLINDRYHAFITYPAASRLHHEYTHGLLEHTLTLANLADRIISYYQELYNGNWLINRDLVIGGILIHDLGKTIELSGPVLTTYTVEGKLIGHISLLNAELLKVSEALGIKDESPTLLSHVVLSHHGKMEYGSPVTPMLKEALLVSMLDDLDAKMKLVEKALAVTNEGEFTDRIWAIDQSSFYKPKK